MEKEKTIGLLHSNYVYYGVGLVLMCTVALFSKQLPSTLGGVIASIIIALSSILVYYFFKEKKICARMLILVDSIANGIIMGLCYKEWIVDVGIVDSFLIIGVSLLITGGATYLLAHSKKKVSVAKWQFVCICVAWAAAGILVIEKPQELLKILVLFLAYHIFIFFGNYILMKEKYKISTVIFWEYIGVYVVLFILFLLIIGEGDGLDFGFGDGEEKKKKKGKGGYNNVNASGSGE